MIAHFKDKNFSACYADVFYAACIALLALAVRAISLEYVEMGGDSLWIWENVVHQVNYGTALVWNHHTLRWAINFPLYLILNCFGTTPTNYYILPVLYSVISAVLAFFLGNILKDRQFGFMSALLLILYPKMTTMGSQLWPGLYEMTYLLGCVLAVFCWRKYGGWYLLAISGLFAGCVWGARVTSLFYAPGIFALIYLGKRKVTPLFIFSAFFFLVVAIEWLYFQNLTGNSFGRLGIITQTHVAKDEHLISVSQYLLNFLSLVKLRGLLPVILAGVGTGCWLVRRGRDEEKGIAILFLSGLFFSVYMISSFNPLKLATPFGSRNITAGSPYLIMVLLLGLRKWQESSPRASKIFKYGLIVAFAVFTFKGVSSQNTFCRLQEDVQNARIITDKNIPVLMRYSAWVPNFIEESGMKLVGYEKKSRLKINEDVKMSKNARRVGSILFGHKGRNDYKPETIDGYYYFYSGDYKSLANSQLVGISEFSRKGHSLTIVPREMLPQNIFKEGSAK